MKTRQLTPQGHRHVEAFCLMAYKCNQCGKREDLWNSRDGVTPFGINCRFCGSDAFHTDFVRDTYAPNHQPRPGQRVFTDMTPERALDAARRRMTQMDGTEYALEGEEREEMVKGLAESWSRPGDPDIIETPTDVAAIEAMQKARREHLDRAMAEMTAKMQEQKTVPVHRGVLSDIQVLATQLIEGDVSRKDQAAWGNRLRSMLEPYPQQDKTAEAGQ